MSKAQPLLSIVATPIIDDGTGYRRHPKCALCDERIRCGSCSMVSLMGDPQKLLRPAHPKCGREYFLYRLAMAGESREVTSPL